ncbi:MAG: protein transcription factor [Gemmatimonadales bacterium]|nr:MAG: protein transcription factor [Gemmatimonadales bacterium]
MALNIKNARVEELVTQVAELTGETKTEAVRKALEERAMRLRRRGSDRLRRERVHRMLESEIWARIPPDQLGQAPDREERERILGISELGA